MVAGVKAGVALGAASVGPHSRRYAWVVLALTFGLLLSDYMSRQVLSAIFPVLKAEWHLSDAALGSLGSVIAVLVGVLTFPLSLIADRLGRVRSIAVMAILWSVATLGCALSHDYNQMLAARMFIGVGEAAYGSVGIAVVMSVFPPSLRATIVGIFTAGGVFGSVIGMALGGAIAEHIGWRWAFVAMAIFGILLGALYPFVVHEERGASPARRDSVTPVAVNPRALAAALFPNWTIAWTYVGSGLQLFISSSIIAWAPSFFHRYYAMSLSRGAAAGSAFVLISGFGMIVCGLAADRLSGANTMRRLALALTFCLMTSLLLTAAFCFAPGNLQLLLFGFAMFTAAGSLGPAGAVVADGTNAHVHATAFATLTLFNNVLGLAPGPTVTGLLADRSSLLLALRLIPVSGLAAAAAFGVAYMCFAGSGSSSRQTEIPLRS